MGEPWLRLRSYRACSLIGSLLFASDVSAQTNVTGGDCSQIIHAEQGATVVIHCAQRARKQLDDTQDEKRRLELHLTQTRKQLDELQAGLERLQGDVTTLRQTDEQSPRIAELEYEIAARRLELQRKQLELDAEQAIVLRAQEQIGTLEHTLGVYASSLRAIEDDRVTPDAYHWVGFTAAVVGFGTAIGFGLASDRQSSDIDATLAQPFPDMSRQDAKELSRSIRLNNTVADVALVVGLLGTVVSATYLWDLLKGRTPGTESVHVSVGAGTLAIRVDTQLDGSL